MKKYYITALTLIFTELLILNSCGNFFGNGPDSAESPDQKPALPASHGTIGARIFLPDYHKLAVRQGRVIAPQSAKVRLST
jgi:hypothetical protein